MFSARAYFQIKPKRPPILRILFGRVWKLLPIPTSELPSVNLKSSSILGVDFS